MTASQGTLGRVRRWRRSGLRFLTLSSGVFAALVLAGLAEFWVLWLAGVEYEPPWALRQVMMSHFSISADGRKAVSRVWLVRRLQNGRENEIALLEPREKRPLRPDFGRLRPRSVAMTSQGDIFAIGSDHGSVYVGSFAENANDLRVLHPGVNGSPVSQIVFSSDGSYLAAVAGPVLFFVSVHGGEMRGRAAVDAKLREVLAISGDGSRLLSCDDRQNLRLWNAADGALLGSVPLARTAVLGAFLSCDGGEAAWVTGDTLHRWDFETGRETGRRTLRHHAGFAVAFASDGRLLATSSNTAFPDRIHIYDAATAEWLQSFDGHENRIAGLTFVAGGELYSWTTQGTIRVWKLGKTEHTRRFSMLEWALSTTP